MPAYYTRSELIDTVVRKLDGAIDSADHDEVPIIMIFRCQLEVVGSVTNYATVDYCAQIAPPSDKYSVIEDKC